ncbi:MAG: AAA family ATPase [Ktedonobacteraceae bacterium]|nr:AAA family ATPase [Ktedonobacteraceae bacterium]
MIILKHLTVERFRLLRALNLHFPQRGSILIQGPNEAGKSALLESIYFALYGKPLNASRSPDDLISYGAESAVVSLNLAVGATELTITRTLQRGKGQQVALQVQMLGAPVGRPITQMQAANERIIQELGWIDGETLRNSCLIEQKGLSRLETISGTERERSIRQMLGLEDLLRLAEQFKVTPDDEQQLHDASERLRLAEMQARIPTLSDQLENIEIALDAVTVREKLAEIEQQEAEIAEQEQALATIRSRRAELKSRQNRAHQLAKADATLAELIAAYDEIAEARRELPELEKQIAELERRERDELPVLEKRVNDLAELTRSFGTLQRMSNDLLSAVETIKELEQDLKQHEETKDDLRSLDEQVAHARMRVQQAKQALNNLEERRRAGRPQLEDRLERLKVLAERLRALQQAEARYKARIESRDHVGEKRERLNQVQRELRDTEQELALVENEAKQAQEQAEAAERRWRQLSVRRQVAEWQRLKSLAQGLDQAEQHLAMARQRQEQLSMAVEEARSRTNRYLMFSAASGIIALLCAIAAIIFYSSASLVGTILGLAAIASGAAAALNWYNYRRAGEEVRTLEKQVQDAINQVGMMVAARETAARMSGGNEELIRIEHEIRTLKASVPRSLEEARRILEQTPDRGESLSDLQQQAKQKRDEANTTRNQVNVTMEAVARLRKERASLEEQRQQEDWEHIEENLLQDRASVELLQQEITLLAGQEGLPLASINARLQIVDLEQLPPPVADEDRTGIPELESLVESTIKATEREIASLDGKLDLVTDLADQVRIHQEALDVLLARQKVIEERNARYQTSSPALQIERAREQQAALSQALQSLRDSLRQRVQQLDIVFSQAAITNAEITARKQLENLQITLGSKIMLQKKHADYTEHLKARQEALAELYKQLSKFSNTLGSWIVPLNPFAEALSALRTRCQREIEEADEPGILREFEVLQNQEGAANAKIALCQQEIEAAQESITALLVQRNRPATKSYALSDLIAVWPLLGDYTVEDRQRLKEQQAALEKELAEMEEQELALSKQLGVAGNPLDLEQARAYAEQQERSYQTKRHGSRLVEAVNERLMRKVIPRTEHYMQQILPLLTGGRYHDAHLVTEPEEGSFSGGPYQLQVWDSGAGEYVPRAALSGGAADQLSLALRLAFAIALLPRELNAAPGFLILDEPLSSFDRGRASSLVEVVTGETLGQHFEQVMLISHSNAFDPATFPYHIYMENGMVIESNLPVVTEITPIVPAIQYGEQTSEKADEDSEIKKKEEQKEEKEEEEGKKESEKYKKDSDEDDEDIDDATVRLPALPAHLARLSIQ